MKAKEPRKTGQTPTMPSSELSCDMSDLLPKALADALSDIIADAHKEWIKEVQLMGAEARASVAELEKKHLQELASLRASYDAQVAGLSALVATLQGPAGRDGAP